jgi:hypothetical protein
MIKAVENYQILNLILKDDLKSKNIPKKVEYYASIHKMLKKFYLIKNALKSNDAQTNNCQKKTDNS